MKSRTCHALSAACLLLLAATGTLADTLLVRQDGSGDHTTIAAAIAAAGDGDLILVGPGTYDEILDITEDLDLRSELGADATVIDGGNAHRLLQIDSAASVDIEGFTFTRAFATGGDYHGGAIIAWAGCQVTITDCAFTDNYASWDNGAVHARGAGTDMTITGSTFVNNFAPHNGGAVGVGYLATLTLDRCEFRDNACSLITGAVNAYQATALNVHDCLFVENTAAVGAILVEASSAQIVGNTFHRNVSFEHASVLFYSGATGSFRENIVSSDAYGAGLKLLNGSCDHACNLYDGNALGPVHGDEIAPDELTLPALFCDAAGDDFTLCADSPALAANNECGQMGAFGEGCAACGVVATEARTWSQVKELYR
jgi:hypothetical protein